MPSTLKRIFASAFSVGEKDTSPSSSVMSMPKAIRAYVCSCVSRFCTVRAYGERKTILPSASSRTLTVLVEAGRPMYCTTAASANAMPNFFVASEEVNSRWLASSRAAVSGAASCPWIAARREAGLYRPAGMVSS
ncbi:MAG: hypothetical protein NT031_19595 [Planctomycetota bacterium]|nr:hypothetical protein [Planctomycetota bacterium]